LLSFAQFEREVIGERIRDKIAASKQKGMWMGGVPPLGYRVQDRKLIIVDKEAEIVRLIFRRDTELGSVRLLKDELALLIRAHRFNATRLGSDGVPSAALAKRQGVSPSYFTRLVRLSYLAPDITQAILDGCQPRDLTADKLLAHSRLPLAWHEQRTVL